MNSKKIKMNNNNMKTKIKKMFMVILRISKSMIENIIKSCILIHDKIEEVTYILGRKWMFAELLDKMVGLDKQVILFMIKLKI